MRGLFPPPRRNFRLKAKADEERRYDRPVLVRRRLWRVLRLVLVPLHRLLQGACTRNSAPSPSQRCPPF